MEYKTHFSVRLESEICSVGLFKLNHTKVFFTIMDILEKWIINKEEMHYHFFFRWL